MSKFKRLFLEMFFEHPKLQALMYGTWLVVMPIIGIFTHIGIAQSILIPLFVILVFKILGALSSALKASIVLLGCEKGDVRYLELYKEWTNEEYEK